MTERFRTQNLDEEAVEYKTTSKYVTENCTAMSYTARPDIWSGTYSPRTRTRTMTDVETPNFYKLRSEGKIINSPMTQTDDIVEDELVNYYQYTGKYKLDCVPQRKIISGTAFLNEGTCPSSVMLNQCGVSLQDSLSYDPQSLIDQAIADAWSNMSLDEVQSLVIAAEMDKSINSLASILKRLYKIFKALRTHDLRKLKREITFKELADRYMEVRYAIRPTLYDVAGVMSALQEVGNDDNTRQTFRGHKYHIELDNSSDEHDCWSWDYGGLWTVKCTIARTSSVQVDVRSGVLAAVQIKNKLPYWGIHHPVEAMWELVPYSFVVDWVLNISKIIGAWTPEAGLSALASWYVVTTEHKTTVQLMDFHHTFNGSNELEAARTSADNVRYSVINTTKQRVPNPSRPIVPSFTLRLDVLKLLDLVVMVKNLLYH